MPSAENFTQHAKVNPDIQSTWNSYEDGNTFLPFFHYSAIIHVNIIFLLSYRPQSEILEIHTE